MIPEYEDSGIVLDSTPHSVTRLVALVATGLRAGDNPLAVRVRLSPQPVEVQVQPSWLDSARTFRPATPIAARWGWRIGFLGDGAV